MREELPPKRDNNRASELKGEKRRAVQKRLGRGKKGAPSNWVYWEERKGGVVGQLSFDRGERSSRVDLMKMV